MKPIEEKFKQKNLLNWIKKQHVSFIELCAIYGALTGQTKDQAAGSILMLVDMIQFLLKNRRTVTLGKKGHSLGTFDFRQTVSQSGDVMINTLTTKYGERLQVETPRTARPTFRFDRLFKKEATFFFCPYCNTNNDQVILVPLPLYDQHLLEVHGVDRVIKLGTIPLDPRRRRKAKREIKKIF